LSPSFYQARDTGFFLPAGVPHRPGTALTLEVQQPSDVYTLLERRAGGKPLSARQMHPGFGSLQEALKLIDLKRSRSVGAQDAYRLTPQIERAGGGGEIATVFPADVCRKFAGQRIRVRSCITYRRSTPLVLWFWRGKASLNGRPARPGDEFFISCDAARGGIELQNTGPEPVEAFTFYPVVDAGAGRLAVH
jgi:hypothetical protein